MVFFNWATMQMAAKIVYYGPGLCGKTSNLSFIYARTSPKSRGEMVSLETESDRTLFFDLLPIEVGTVGGFKTRLQLYTVPGQVFYNTTRKLVLKGVDGLVFVADSQRPMREANIESLRSLMENIDELGVEIDDIPMVLQYNKRDLNNILTVEELNADLNSEGKFPYHLSSAINGDGVFETLKEITKITLKKLRKRMASPQEETVSRTVKVESAPPPTSEEPAEKPGAIFASSLARAAEEGVGDDSMFGAETPPMQAGEADLDATEEAVSLDAPQAQPLPDEITAAPEPEVSPDEITSANALVEQAEEVAASDHVEEIVEVDFPEPEEAAKEIEEISVEFEEIPEETEEIPEVVEVIPEESIDVGTPLEEVPVEEEVEEILFEGESEGDEGRAEVKVEFDTSAEEPKEKLAPPPMKRVQVSSEMDILSELDGLRRSATGVGGGRRAGSADAADLDLDNLLTGKKTESRDIKRRIEQRLNSNVFERMHSMQLAFRVQNKEGETIHTLDPVSLSVDDAASLKNLILQLTIDLENIL